VKTVTEKLKAAVWDELRGAYTETVKQSRYEKIGAAKKKALALVDRAVALANGSPDIPLSVRCPDCTEGVTSTRADCPTCRGEGVYIPKGSRA